MKFVLFFILLTLLLCSISGCLSESFPQPGLYYSSGDYNLYLTEDGRYCLDPCSGFFHCSESITYGKYSYNSDEKKLKLDNGLILDVIKEVDNQSITRYSLISGYTSISPNERLYFFWHESIQQNSQAQNYLSDIKKYAH